MKPRRAAWLPIAGFLALACAGTPPQIAPGSPFLALLQREIVLPPAVEVATADGAIRARVAGRLIGAFEKTPDGSYLGRFAIATEVPVVCRVFIEAKDPASTLAAMSEQQFGALAATKKVENKAIFAIDAANIGAQPYLGLDWIATLDDAGYELKQKVGTRGDRSLYCMHDEPGYSTTFDRFFSGFLASLDEPDGEEPMVYRDVTVLEIAGNEAGYQTVRVRRDEHGDYRTVTQSSVLIPAAFDQLLASDDYSIEVSRSDGSVIDEVQISNGAADYTKLELSRAKGAWVVHGEMQGKKISERFEKPASLASAIDENRRMLRLVRGDAKEERYWRWLGAISPGKAIEHVMSRSGDSSVRIAAGPFQLDADVDELGAVRGSMKIGRMQIEMKRIYVDGSL